MKAVLSNRIYMEVNSSLQSKIDEELTYSIPPRNPQDPPFIIKNMGVIRKGVISYTYRKNGLNPKRLRNS